MNSYSYVCFNYSILLHDVNRFFLFSSSSWLTPVHEKDLVLCLMRILARCVEVLRQFDFPLKGRSELFEPRRGEF